MPDTNAEWVGHRIGRELDADEERIVDTLCSIARPYNLHMAYSNDVNKNYGWNFERSGNRPFLIVRLYTRIASHDMNELTRLVVAAHRNHVRVEISPASQFTYELALHARNMDEDADRSECWSYHPTLEDLIARCERG